ncbi:MAG: MaoC family dehydratase N-terminal domain-containing protein [Dehalococcoidia bacterium]
MALDYIPEYLSDDARKQIEAMAEKETEPVWAPGPVCEWLIKHWCETTEDGNPLYLDEDFAKESPHGSLISPPGMLGTWMVQFRWPWPPRDRKPGGTAIHQTMKDLLDLPVGIQVDQEVEFYQPLKVGDRLCSSQRLSWIGPWKKTRLGEGHFWRVDGLFRNQDHEMVARGTSTFFGYGRGTVPVAAPEAPKGGWSNAIEQAIQGDRTGYQPPPFKTLYFEDVGEGDELPKLVMPVTVTRCVYLASATRDFSPQHSNRDYAQEQSKTKDMFLNTPFFQGMIARCLTDWTGPEGVIRKIKIAMRGNICAGDDLIITGKVIKTYQESGENRVDVALDVCNQDGPATSASGTVALPSRASS